MIIFHSLLHQVVLDASTDCIASKASVWSLGNYEPKAPSGQLGEKTLGPGRIRTRWPLFSFAYCLPGGRVGWQLAPGQTAVGHLRQKRNSVPLVRMHGREGA
jgi:hypothetical protein